MKKSKQKEVIVQDKPVQYVIYCRKSTDETSWKQVQSIPDQIRSCIKYAEDNNLIIRQKPKDFSDFESKWDIFSEDHESDLNSRELYQKTRHLFIIKEQETWKIPFKRKKWRKLIKMISNWEVDWLLSYSPDRQSRNMLEWWELIDFVDQDVLDLKYTNFYFEPTASWKMMLWIWFVFSKQYSDKLKEDSMRWTSSAFYKWKSIWIYKHWYKINDEWFHTKDERYFDLIKEAFRMKIEDYKPDTYIEKYLKENWYKRNYKNERKTWDISNWILWNIWKDSFYHGIFISGDRQVDLRWLNPHYEPMITEDEYFKLIRRLNVDNCSTYAQERKEEIEEYMPFDSWLLKTEDDFIITSYLPNPQRFKDKIAKNPNLKYEDIVKPINIKFKCWNSKSKLKDISSTFEEIQERICEFLKKIKLSEDMYNEYTSYFRLKLDEENAEHKEARSKLQFEYNKIYWANESYIKANAHLLKNTEFEHIYNNEIKSNKIAMESITNQMNALETKNNEALMWYEMFAKFLKNASKFYFNASYVQKRKIARILFLNIKISPSKVYFEVKPWLEDMFLINWLPRLDSNQWPNG